MEKDRLFRRPASQAESRFSFSPGDSFRDVNEVISKGFKLHWAPKKIIIKEFEIFIAAMQNCSSVEALAFLASRGYGPNMLIYVFTPLEIGAIEIDAIDKAVAAESILSKNLESRKLRSKIQIGLRFADTVIGGLSEADSKRHKIWSENPFIKPLAFVIFNREKVL